MIWPLPEEIQVANISSCAIVSHRMSYKYYRSRPLRENKVELGFEQLNAAQQARRARPRVCCPSFSSRPRPIMPSTPMAWSRPDHHSGWSSVASRRRHRFGHEHDWTSCVVLTASKSTTVPSRGHGHREEARDVGPGYRPPRNLSASIRSRVAPRTLTGVLAPWRPSLSRFVRFGRVARVTALNFSIDFEV